MHVYTYMYDMCSSECVWMCVHKYIYFCVHYEAVCICEAVCVHACSQQCQSTMWELPTEGLLTRAHLANCTQILGILGMCFPDHRCLRGSGERTSQQGRDKLQMSQHE